MSGAVPPALLHEAIRLVRACVPSFAALSSDPSNFTIDALTLGTTNQLVRVKLSEAASSSASGGVAVVVRFYGTGTDRLISRASEVALQSLFLKTFKKFPNALVYEFLEGKRELDSKEFKAEPCVGRLSRLFAGVHSGVLWRDLHKTATEEDGGSKGDVLTLQEGPTSPHQQQLCISSSVSTPIPPPQTGPSAPTFVDTSLTNWVSILVELSEDGVEESLRKEGDIELFRSMGMTKEALVREVAFIRSVLSNNADLLPLAVCHNDLNCFNILVNKRHPVVAENSNDDETPASPPPPLSDAELFDEYRLIDFEYSGWGHIYFDIGNHFNEFAGVDVTSDFSLTFPDDAFIEGWLRKYFEALQRDIDSIAALPSSSGGCGLANQEEEAARTKREDLITWLSLPSTKALPTTDEEFAKAVQLTKFFSLVSHFLWSVWSVIQATQSVVDFGFVPYGKMRWCRYLEKKEEFTKGLLSA